MRIRHLITAALAVALLALPAAASAKTVHRDDLLHHFSDAGTEGTMVVHRAGPRPETVVVNAERSRRRYLPSSTFKIPNSLLAIDRGVASGGDHPYPGPNPNFIVDGRPFLPAACEGDLTLTSAFRFSCIPIYQRIARELGRPVYRRAMKAMHYGNRDVDSAPLDLFWLEGPFAISAREQMRFLERLCRGALPVSRHAIREVHEMMVMERTDDTVLRGKTGYVFSTQPHRGWWVGWVERAGRSWTFALNLDITQPSHPGARLTIGRAILTELGALG